MTRHIYTTACGRDSPRNAAYSAASRAKLAVFLRMVTSSSAAVGMQRNRGIKVGFLGAHSHGNGGDLSHFGGALADHVATDDLIGQAVDDKLHQYGRSAPRERRFERPEHGLVDVGTRQPGAGLRFGESDRADLGVGEYRRRHVAVIDRGRPAAEHGVGKSMALADRDRSEIDAVGNVADSVNVRR